MVGNENEKEINLFDLKTWCVMVGVEECECPAQSPKSSLNIIRTIWNLVEDLFRREEKSEEEGIVLEWIVLKSVKVSTN